MRENCCIVCFYLLIHIHMLLSSNLDQVYSRFSLRDLAMFKCYLLAWGILFAIRVPALRDISLWFYIIVFAVLCVYFLYRFFWLGTPAMTGRWLFARKLATFHSFNLVEIGAYKLMLFVVGIGLVIIFPELMTIHTGRYIAVWFFGGGYFLHKVLHQ